jgi:hypothetical protein
MSEWYHSQRKPNIDFRKLLQKRLDKANPHRKLTAEEQQKLEKLNSIVKKLMRG